MYKTIERNITRNMTTWKPRYFDIGVNFSDPMFQGYYNHSSTPKHPPDLDKVISRAHLFNVKTMLVTASNIQESKDHFELCDRFPNQFYSTVGVHPCTVAQEFYEKVDDTYTETLRPDCSEKLEILKDLVVKGVERGTVKAFGEIGLDYDRFHYSSKSQQITMFKKQLDVISSLAHLKLPLFLHMRSACDDFIDVIKPYIDDGSIERGNGVVHSFTGTKEELQKLLDLGFFIGVNGCSLRTEENLEVARSIPKERLMIETDAPWCEIRKSHPSYKLVTPYPNIFYPEIPILEKVPEEASPIVIKKSQPQKKQSIKLDELLPFPSIKKENYEKHLSAVQALSELGKEDDRSGIGEFASPLMKSRNEPVFVGLVAEILCKLGGITEEKEIEHFIDLIYDNSCKLFKI